MDLFLTILSVLLAVACAVAVTLLMSQRRRAEQLERENAAAAEALRAAEAAREAERAGHEDERMARVRAEADLEAERRAVADKVRSQQQMEQALREQFRALAGDVLGEQSRRFKEENRESMDIILKPFKDNIREFRERVEKIHSGNSKVQGDWGEMLLETILDNSNLVRGVHYQTQYNVKDAEGNNLRPDVVLFLPAGKQIVIDSKVSLTAYVNYAAAEIEAERRAALAAHVASVRQHVNELGRKEYQRLMQSPDFVIMFVPNEPAFLAAMQADGAIWGDAYDKKVIVSSPTNLFALLKLVDDLWRRDEQSRNQEKIIKYGVALYEQLVAFTSALEGVGLELDQAKARYDEAFKRLHTGNNNIVRNGERLRRLGLPTSKRQPQRILDETEGLDDGPDMLPENDTEEAENE